MCEYLSAFINVRTMDVIAADFHSHSESARILGIDLGPRQEFREFEWKTEAGLEGLSVRVLPTDPLSQAQAVSFILSRWPTRSDLLGYLVPRLPASVTTLDLSCATIPEKLAIPASVTTLDLRYATIPEKLAIPASARAIRS